MNTEHDRARDESDDPAKPLDELLGGGSTVMVGTEAEGSWQFRPLTVARVSANLVSILLDSNEEWVKALRGFDKTLVTLSDNRSNTYASLEATSDVVFDEALIDELWNPAAGAFFDDGRETPGIAVMQISVSGGRYWAAPSGRIGSLIAAVKAKLGKGEDAGEHGEVATSASRSSS